MLVFVDALFFLTSNIKSGQNVGICWQIQIGDHEWKSKKPLGKLSRKIML